MAKVGLSGVTIHRIGEEYELLRRSKDSNGNTYLGVKIKLRRNKDKTRDLSNWHCYIPAPKNTLWEGAYYPFHIEFLEDFPFNPPIIRFPPGFKHLNVFDDGLVCMQITTKNGFGRNQGWDTNYSIKKVVQHLSELFSRPNINHITGINSMRLGDLYLDDKDAYEEEIRKQRDRYAECNCKFDFSVFYDEDEEVKDLESPLKKRYKA